MNKRIAELIGLRLSTACSERELQSPKGNPLIHDFEESSRDILQLQFHPPIQSHRNLVPKRKERSKRSR